MKAVFFLALVSSATALVARNGLSRKTNPVTAIVSILKDMGKQLEKDLEDDKKVHEELVCWCKTGLKDLKATVADSPPRIERFMATMGTSEAKVAELKETRKSVEAGLRKDTAALSKATGIRMNENKAFRKSRLEVTASLDSLRNAQLVMGKKASFAQMRAVTKDLLEKRVSDVAIEQSTALTRETIDEFSNYFNKVDSDASFLAVSGSRSYAPQGGQIMGMLAGMEDEFKKSLAASTAAETKAQTEYESVQAAKQAEIESAKAQHITVNADSAAFQEKYEHAAKAHKHATAAFATDQQNLIKMQKTCSGSEAEYENRVKDRLTEITGVSETIKILNDDSARAAFNKAPALLEQPATALVEQPEKPSSYMDFLNFFQMTSQKQQSQRKQALAMIQTLASESASPQLALLALTARTQGFKEITAHIDKLIEAVKVEQKEEETHRTWCKGETIKNQGATDKATDKRDSLKVKLASVKSEIKATSAELASSVAEVAKMRKQIANAAKLRKENQADLQKTIEDNTVMAEILRSAIARMKQVYAFLQEEQGEESDESGAPQFAKNSAKNAGGGKVVTMLTELLNSTAKTVQDAKDAEVNNAEAFETTSEDLEYAIKLQNGPQNDAESEIAVDQEDLSAESTDLAQTLAKLKNVNGRTATTKKSCDYIVENFADRTAARTTQEDKLTELKTVLLGA